MNAEIVFIAVICSSLVLCTNVQAQATEFEVIQVPLQPRVTSDGESILLNIHKTHRVARSTSTCTIPPQLENSNLTCVLYPDKVKCIQTCMFGYTFGKESAREMVCEHVWNKWKPVPEFESCDPFIDCGASLSSGGDLKCYSHFMDRGTMCEISCHNYEDKTAIPKKVYGCNIDGSWTPELPFCAQAGSGLALVPPPRR